MRGVNMVVLLGSVGKDPEIRSTSGGKAIAAFSLATSQSWNDKQSGEKVERTEWHNCVAFGKLAEIIGQYVHKGSKVYVRGSLKTDQYEKAGQKHYSTKIEIDELQMLDSKPSGDQKARDPDRSPTREMYAEAHQGADDDPDDPLPF